jgi:hypothetical protein
MAAVRARRASLTSAVAVACAIAATTSCDPEQGPTVTITLNAVPAPLNALMIAPPSGFVINVTAVAQDEPVDPATLWVAAVPWNGAPLVDLTAAMTDTPTGAVGVVPPELALAPPNTYTLVARLDDTAGDAGIGRLDFAVRDFPNGPPLGTWQLIWYDFDVDRDGDGDRDFPEDLAAVGLGSTAAPALSEQVESEAIDRIVDRVQSAYWGHDPNGIGQDPVAVAFLLVDPGPIEKTRICVGGAAPGSPNLVGSILIDPGNANRASVECGTLPPSGIFPRGLLAYANNYHFQGAFDPLMPSRGGIPVGAHPLDAVVLAPGFDPGTSTPEELARWNDVENAIQIYANALGTIAAHETGHALGLVEPGAPGIGLHGGVSGDQYAHDVNADGSVPSENFLMKAGPSVKFQHVAGLGGNPLPFFRPLDFAYLRDRAVIDSRVTALLAPPVVTSAEPTLLTGSAWITATGSGFSGTPRMRLVSASYTYELISETLLSSTQVKGLVSFSQVPTGSYTLSVENPDGQLALAPLPIAIQR